MYKSFTVNISACFSFHFFRFSPFNNLVAVNNRTIEKNVLALNNK